MKKITIIILSVIISSSAFAQQANDYLELSRSVLKTEKKALIAEVMQLTEEESTVFWPLYNEYEQKKYDVNTMYFKVIQDFADNFNSITEEKANELVKRSINVEMQLVKLKKTYSKKFAKIISPQKTLRYMQAENKIKALINAEMMMEVPLLEMIEN